MTASRRDPAALVAGSWQPGDGTPTESINPTTGAAIWTGTNSSPEQATAAVRAAAAAFTAWRRTPLDDRAAIVRRFAELVTERRESLAELIALETGKPMWDAQGELMALAGKSEVSLTAFADRSADRETMMGPTRVEVTHRAHGPVAVIGPFNFPALLPNSHIIPALIAGNTVVFKPSELAPVVGTALADLWLDAGLPDGVLNLVLGGPPIVEALMAAPEIRGVFFTGGVGGGSAVLRALAERPEVLTAVELGGNNPLIAWQVADPVAAARVVVHSAFVSAGQRCLCARRLIVPDDASGTAVVDAVVAIARQLRVGDPLGSPAPFMGPLINEASADRVLAAQDALVAAGAQVLLPATRIDGPSRAFLSAGVLDVSVVASLPDEEIFGPVLQVQRVADLDAALAAANATRFGLVASALSDDPDVIARFRDESTAGMVNVNVSTVAASGFAPFGGTGWSGNHRPSGYYAADYCSLPISTLSQPTVGDPGPIHGYDDAT